MAKATRRWSFIVPIALFTLFCSLLVWLITWWLKLPMGALQWGVISYFMSLTFLLHAWQESALERDPNGFVGRYFAGLTIKMFLSFGLLVLLLTSVERSARLPLAITFIVLYLAYLGFSTARMTFAIRKRMSDGKA